jgi:23S rRNA pseudouridine1911/1915/1917 synthase
MLTDHVRSQDRRARVFIVHRLDRETSGLLVFAKTPEAKRGLQERWSEMVLDRSYIAVVEGRVSRQRGTVRSNLKENNVHRVYSTGRADEGKPAVTHFEVLAGNNSYTMLRVTLGTGRRNQIRVHMLDICHTVAGDRRYGASTDPLRRLALHAASLTFRHPRTGELLSFESPPPSSFSRLVRKRHA